ncbi:MATE family efflux transporter [Alphaproteobacteria bacterium KMM 3653]|uniref:Multidrug-efflux transporter n=2 Tax=Harenicola maris TaxID=2841044 RepID=A0AAP2G567_9RHOB|nr:MATE family efflux transporter [Harenicola maris]
MTPSAHGRAILVLGLPLIGGNLGQIAIGVTDTLMLGWYSVDALAAAVLGHSMWFSIFLLGSGFANAVMPLVAEASEQPDGTQTIRRTARMGLWLSVLFAVLVLPLFLWSSPILQALGQTKPLSDDAQDLLRIVGLAMLPALLAMVLKSYLAALEHTRVVLWVTIAAALVNAGVNYLLIFGNYGAPELGIKGAGYASSAVHCVTLLLLAGYALRKFPEHDLLARLWRPDPEVIKRLFSMGVPIGLTYLAETSLFAASALMMGWLGTVPLAAHGVAIQIASATFVVHLGLSSAATVRVGKALGRQDFPHLRRGAVVAVWMSVAFALMTVAVYWSIPATLIGMFIDPADPLRPEIISAGITLMLLAGVFQLVDGAQAMALGLLRGLKDTQVPMIYAVLSYWCVGMTCSYLLGFTLGLGGAGIWGGLSIGLCCAAVSMMLRFWRHIVPRAEQRSAVDTSGAGA